MILSHKHKYIFLKTAKTAGTSIEIALSKFCGPDDVITPISPIDEQTRLKLGYPGPQHHLSSIKEYRPWDVLRLLLKWKRKLRFYNHMPGSEVLELTGREVWDRYYKFCFERNPWDRVVSLYYWRHKSEPRPSFSDFIRSGTPLMLKKKGYQIYTIDGKVAVNRVCKYEDISEELDEVQMEIGIEGSLELPMAKTSFRKGKQSYREMFNEEDRSIVAEMFREEINLFGYRFE